MNDESVRFGQSTQRRETKVGRPQSRVLLSRHRYFAQPHSFATGSISSARPVT
jgi:hypothetical protein